MERPSTIRLALARIFIVAVFAVNVSCALSFICDPASYVGAYQVEGASACAIVQSIGIAFLMWNATYPPVALWPCKQRVLFTVVIAQQTIGLVGESMLAASLGPELAVLQASIIRFIAFDGAGLVLLVAAFLLTRVSRSTER